MKTKSHRFAPNTVLRGDLEMTRNLGLAIEQRDLRLAAACLAEGANPNLQCLSYTPDIDDDDVTDLTPTSLAALVDSTRGELLFLPLLLNRGGTIRQIDTRGRTLLHFAWHEVVARYLIEHGVPLPNGSRERLLKGLDRRPGAPPLDADGRLDYADGGGEPSPVAMASGNATYPWFQRLAAPVPVSRALPLVSPDLADAMTELGYATGQGGAEKPGTTASAPPLVGCFDATVEIEHALRERAVDRVRGLLELGGATGGRQFECVVELDGRNELWFDVDALGLAVLLDSRANEVLLTKAFEPWVEFGGEHGNEGESLLHLALAPKVCAWLLERGISPDARNDDGMLAEQMLPPQSSSVITRWRLENAVQRAGGEVMAQARL